MLGERTPEKNNHVVKKSVDSFAFETENVLLLSPPQDYVGLCFDAVQFLRRKPIFVCQKLEEHP